MARLTPDPTFYPSPRMAMAAPPEKLAYVATIGVPTNGQTNGQVQHDALVTLDVDPASSAYGQTIGRVQMPQRGDELHHFGWNACSSALCPNGPHPHVERRYRLVPGLRSSRIHILDTKPDARQPRLVKVIEPEEVARKTGYSRPHTTHCGPDGIYVNAIGAPDGNGPGGIFVLDHDDTSIKGRWEKDLGRPVLPGRHPRLGRQTGRRAGGRHDARPTVLRALPGRRAPAPGPTRGR
jgi:selenium-binding protein 1